MKLFTNGVTLWKSIYAFSVMVVVVVMSIIITGATGTISKSFRKYVSNIPGKRKIKELQETSILGTAHVLRKVLM